MSKLVHRVSRSHPLPPSDKKKIPILGLGIVAGRTGFEPATEVYGPGNRLAGGPIRPLWHLPSRPYFTRKLEIFQWFAAPQFCTLRSHPAPIEREAKGSRLIRVYL